MKPTPKMVTAETRPGRSATLLEGEGIREGAGDTGGITGMIETAAEPDLGACAQCGEPLSRGIEVIFDVRGVCHADCLDPRD